MESDIAVSCGVGHRRGLDLAWLWLWLWHRLAVVAPIGPKAWELPCAVGAAQTNTQTKKTLKKQKQKKYPGRNT